MSTNSIEVVRAYFAAWPAKDRAAGAPKLPLTLMSG
jgi:hypothetical protein